MIVAVNDIEFFMPDTLANYTLSQRIAFQRDQGNTLDAMLKSILEMKPGPDRDLEYAEYQLEACYRGFAFFSGVDLETVKEANQEAEITALYTLAMSGIDETAEPELLTRYTWNDETWMLPPPDLKNGNKMTFGEFIDAKQVIKQGQELKQSKWETLLNLCAIYFRRESEPYQESFFYDGSERLELMKSLPLSFALCTAKFFDDFSAYVDKHFPVFHNSKTGKAGKNMSNHFNRWGWINFLKSISKTKEFDVQGSGLNSIECARRAPLYDVLWYASEAKDYAESQYLDAENERRANASKR